MDALRTLSRFKYRKTKRSSPAHRTRKRSGARGMMPGASERGWWGGRVRGQGEGARQGRWERTDPSSAVRRHPVAHAIDVRLHEQGGENRCGRGGEGVGQQLAACLQGLELQPFRRDGFAEHLRIVDALRACDRARHVGHGEARGGPEGCTGSFMEGDLSRSPRRGGIRRTSSRAARRRGSASCRMGGPGTRTRTGDLDARTVLPA